MFFRRYIGSSNSEDALHQLTFWVTKVNIDEAHEARISKTLEIDYRVYRKENG